MPQHIREQAMVAVPLVPLIQRHDEQIRLFEPVQHHRSIPGSRTRINHRLAQGPRKCIQKGTPQQELANVGGLTIQHFAGEKVHQHVRATLQMGQQCVRIRVVAQR